MTRSNERGIPQRYAWARRPRAATLAALLLAAGCSGAPESDIDATTTVAPVRDGDSSASPDADATGAESRRPVDGPLVEVCPSTIVVQTTGQPGVPFGPLHLLTGPEAVVDEGAVSGAFTRPDGTVEDITFVVRSGGPVTGFQDAIDVASADDTITLVHTSTAAMLRRYADSPMVAVAALTDRSSEAVIVDPATYPDVTNLDDVADAGIEIQHFTDSPAFEFLGSAGPLSPDQLVDGFDGGPAAFVAANGTLAQQGDLLVDPALFASLPQWSRPVVAMPLSDAGWADHDDVLAVRANDVDDLDECLARVVPVVQQAIVAYVDDPSPTNALIARARLASDPLSRVTVGLLDAGAAEAVDLGVIGNGVDDTVGDVDTVRLTGFLSRLADVLGVGDVPIDELVDDSFIVPGVGL